VITTWCTYVMIEVAIEASAAGMWFTAAAAVSGEEMIQNSTRSPSATPTKPCGTAARAQSPPRMDRNRFDAGALRVILAQPATTAPFL